MTRLPKDFDIVCLSHLKWEETLFQRPQQIMRRMSESHRVVYIGRAHTRDFVGCMLRLDRSSIVGRCGRALIYVNLPYLPLTRFFPFLDSVMWAFGTFCGFLLASLRRFRNVCLWIYHPDYVTHVGLIPHRALVYDCMDLFRGFKVAHGGTPRREERLIERADIVFTGGRSLQRAHESLNPRTYCYPSGVDFEHFGQALDEATPIASELKSIPRPILGYFGAIDERIDFALLDHLCEQRPHYHVVLIGPLLSLSEIPVRRENLHYFGKRKYAELPSFLKGFDVCLMPFVISELTLHISPTKTPEYLAGGRPVVSSAIPDVMEDYADMVHIAVSKDDFVDRIDEALKESHGDLPQRLHRKKEARTWREIASEMERHLLEL